MFALVQGPELGWALAGILVALAAGLLLLGRLRHHRAAQPRSAGAAPAARQPRPHRSACVIAFMFMATFGSLLYFLSIYFQEVLGYDALADRRRLPAPHGRGRRRLDAGRAGW